VLQGAYDRARSILTSNESELHALAGELLEKETLGGDQIRVIMKQVRMMTLRSYNTVISHLGSAPPLSQTLAPKPNCAPLSPTAVPQSDASFRKKSVSNPEASKRHGCFTLIFGNSQAIRTHSPVELLLAHSRGAWTVWQLLVVTKQGCATPCNTGSLQRVHGIGSADCRYLQVQEGRWTPPSVVESVKKGAASVVASAKTGAAAAAGAAKGAAGGAAKAT